MVSTRLEINNISQPFGVNIPVVLTFNLADIREPDKRKATFSKTILLPATNSINKVFENIFEVNLATQYFNKNKKTSCKYFVNDILNFSGDLKLSKITINPDLSIVYEVNVIGEGGTLFVNIGEKLITGNADASENLDFSAYNHTYNGATQRSTRSNVGTGLGVLYPFIDRGTNGGSDTVWNTNDFLPTFHMFEYVKKIIEKAGYTFTSSILSGSDFKSQIMYPNITSLALSSAQLSNRQFYVGLLADYTLPLNNTYYVINHDNETGGFFDVGNQNAPETGIVTLNESGFYNVVSHDKFQISFTHTDPLVTYATGNFYKGTIVSRSTDGGISYGLTLSNGGAWDVNDVDGSIPVTKINAGTNYTNVFDAATGEQFFTAGTKMYKQSLLQRSNVKFFGTAGQITTGTATFTVKVLSGINGNSFYGLATQKNIVAGNALLANNALPIKMKQKDILKSVFQALNLYVEADPTNEKNLIIESFNEFYNTTTPVNFENKTDISKEQTINPNLLEGKRYIFAYKPDVDKYNVLYQTDFNETFGTETIEVDNDFIKSDKKNELVFSATPNVANYGLGIAHPRIFKEEGNIKKTITPNVRWLYCGGVMQAANAITYTEQGQPDFISNDYLYAGHTNNPFLPTFDLNFGLPKRVDYTFIGAYFTTNNAYNRHHKFYLETITDRDAKIVTKWVYWNPKDINEFSFRNRLFIENAYWIVNKIDNYEALAEQSTLTELIKLNKSNVFVPTQILISDSTAVSTGEEIYTARLNNSLNVGSGIQNKGANNIAIGDNIIIPESSKGITVIGNNVVIAEGVSNTTLINTSNVTVTQSNVTYINGIIENTFEDLASVITTKTASGDVLVTNGTLLYDCTTGNLTANLPKANDCFINGVGKIFNIKKIDATANTLTIDGRTTETIDGSLTKVLTIQYASLTIQSDGLNWNII